MDTSVAVEVIRNPDVVWGCVNPSAELCISSIVLGELHFGALRSRRVDDNVKSVERFASGVFVLGCDDVVARKYGEIRSGLESKGRRNPENDVWIAATALANALPILTADADFRAVEGLAVVEW